MKHLNFILTTTIMAISSIYTAEAQEASSREYEILKQLSSQPAAAGMPAIGLLNAPGNEKLKTFFFTPIQDPGKLRGKRVAVLAADGFEEIELLGPVWYFRALGAKVEIVAPKFNPTPARFGLTTPEMAKDHIMAIQYLTPVGWVKVDRTADQVRVDDYDAIMIPGGAWNPDNLRVDKDAVRFIQEFYKSGKLVGAICHGPVVLVTADILKGKKLTGYWNVQTDLKNAGGIVSDVPVVVDGNLITSRHPIDIAEFATAMSEWLAKH